MQTKTELRNVVSKQKHFFSREEAGALLIFIVERPAPSGQPPCRSIMQRVNEFVADNPGRLPQEDDIDTMMSEVVSEFRLYWRWRSARVPDDALPVIPVHFDIGIQTAVMTGLEPAFLSGCWWLEPNLAWDAIESLEFDPHNRWLEVFVHINRALWRTWDEDYFFLPFLHRSPLDAANGIRGTPLFEEMITAPERVKRLVEWCVDCELAIERYLYERVERPEGWGVGHMSVWLPEGAVWVNGDPVTMISRDFMKEFEQPYTGRLFTSRGGGFFHNHTKGLFQVDQVAQTPGIILQHFNADPNCPRFSEVLSEDPVRRETILQASQETPIYVDNVSVPELEAFLPYLPHGRFLLEVICDPDETDSLLAVLKGTSRMA